MMSDNYISVNSDLLSLLCTVLELPSCLSVISTYNPQHYGFSAVTKLMKRLNLNTLLADCAG